MSWQDTLPEKTARPNRYKNAVRLDDDTHERLMILKRRLGHSAMAIVKALIAEAEIDTRRDGGA